MLVSVGLLKDVLLKQRLVKAKTEAVVGMERFEDKSCKVSVLGVE